MRRRARHRLIGAAVLVLIGVVGFPLLFDTQPRPIRSISGEIPDQANSAPEVVPGTQVASQTAHRQGVLLPMLLWMMAKKCLRLRPSLQLLRRPLWRLLRRGGAAAAVGTAAAVASQVKPEPKPESNLSPSPSPNRSPSPSPSPKSPRPRSSQNQTRDQKPEAKPEPKHKPEAPKVDEAARARALLEGAVPRSSCGQGGCSATSASSCRSALLLKRQGQRNQGQAGGRSLYPDRGYQGRQAHPCSHGAFQEPRGSREGCARAKGLGLPASVFKA
jgi:DedD protein